MSLLPASGLDKNEVRHEEKNGRGQKKIRASTCSDAMKAKTNNTDNRKNSSQRQSDSGTVVR